MQGLKSELMWQAVVFERRRFPDVLECEEEYFELKLKLLVASGAQKNLVVYFYELVQRTLQRKPQR